MLAPLQRAIVEAVQSNPGVGPVADALGRDKSQVRRAMRDLARRGHLVERNTSHGYAYFPVGNAVPNQQNALDHHQVQRRQPDPQIIEAPFRDVTPAIARPAYGCPYRKLYPTGALPRIGQCFVPWERCSN
jgi:DNA-binding transcriptional MocR family regulator